MTSPRALNPYQSPGLEQPPSEDDLYLPGKLASFGAIIAEGTLTEADYLNVHRLIRSKRESLFYCFLLLSYVVYWVIILASIGFTVITTIAALLLFVFLLIPGYRNSRYYQRLHWRKVVRALKPRQILFTPDTIEIHSPTQTNILSWSSLCCCICSQELLILAENNKIFHPFARHFFQSERDWQQVVHWAAEKLENH